MIDRAMIAQTAALLLPAGTTSELRILHTPRDGTVSGYFQDQAAFVQAAAAWSGKAPAVYATLNPCQPALLARAANRLKPRAKTTTADSDIVHRVWLPLDFDPVRPADISSTDAEHAAALDRAGACMDWLAQRGWPAPVAADSGNGAHLLYRIDLPTDTASRDLLERCLQALALHFSDDVVKLDTGVFNAARIWKVYGTVACKGDSLPERPHRLARLLEAPHDLQPVSRAQLDALAALVPVATTARPRTSAAGHTPFDLPHWMADHGLQVASSGPWGTAGTRWVLNPCPWNEAHTNKSAFVVQFASGAIAAGCHHNGCHEETWHTLRDLVEPGWNTARVAQTAQQHRTGQAQQDASQRRNGPTPAPEGATTPASGPTITQYPSALPAVIAQAEEALAASTGTPRLFQRSHMLVLVQPAEPTPKDRIQRATGAPVIRVCPASTLRYCLAQAATWFAERGKRLEQSMPQPWVVDTLLDLGNWPHLPVLTGIITAPTLRPDGTVLATPGYDQATGLYYAPGETVFPAIPERPTREDIDEAFEILEEPFQDFPFKEAHHKSAAFAALFTTLLRYAIPGHVPLFGVSAPTAGTGKTLVVDTIAIIASGRPAPKLSQPTREEEWNKQLLTCALEGDQLVLIDNCVSTLASGELCKAVTAQVLKGRILGVHQNGEAPQHAVYFATGNSLRFRGDIVRRTIPITLESSLERPETRTGFAIDTPLEVWTQTHRPQLVAAALTLLRGYHLAPDTPTVPTLGSFEAWCQMVCGPLVWLGMPNPIEGVEAIKDDDDEREQLRTLLMAWQAVYADKAVTLRHAKDDINSYTRDSEAPSTTYHALADALKAFDRSRDTLLNIDSVGQHLRQVAGRIVCGKTLVRGNTRSKTGYPWKVVTKHRCPCEACCTPGQASG
jgi:hypothetical protein